MSRGSLLGHVMTGRSLVFIWQPSIVYALNEIVSMVKIGYHYVIQYFHLKVSASSLAKLDSFLG